MNINSNSIFADFREFLAKLRSSMDNPDKYHWHGRHAFFCMSNVRPCRNLALLPRLRSSRVWRVSDYFYGIRLAAAGACALPISFQSKPAPQPKLDARLAHPQKAKGARRRPDHFRRIDENCNSSLVPATMARSSRTLRPKNRSIMFSVSAGAMLLCAPAVIVSTKAV